MKPLFKTKQKPLREISPEERLVGVGGTRAAINPKSRIVDFTVKKDKTPTVKKTTKKQ